MRNLAKLFGIIVIVMAIAIGVSGCNTLQSIDLQPPVRTIFGQGQDMDTTGLLVTANYKKNTETVTNISSLRITGYNKNIAGDQTVTVTMNAKSGLVSSNASNTFTVTVIPVESISISQLPAAASFKQGDTPNWNGLSVAVKFDRDAVSSITVAPGTNSMIISGYDKDRAGTQTITVDYYGKRATFNVNVIGLDSITITSQPRKTEYYIGEEIDLTGIVVQGSWSDSSTARVNITQNDLSGYDITRGEVQNVTVSYSGKTTAFQVTYIAFSALSVDRPPTKTKYELGEELDTMGMRIFGSWTGNSLALVDNSRVIITGYDPLRTGEQRITVTVAGRSDYFTVTVINPFEGTWIGQWSIGTETVDGKRRDIFTPVILTIDESVWSLRTRDRSNENVELRGVFIPVSNTQANLQSSDSRGTGSVSRDSSTVMRLRNALITSEITLDKGRP